MSAQVEVNVSTATGGAVWRARGLRLAHAAWIVCALLALLLLSLLSRWDMLRA